MLTLRTLRTIALLSAFTLAFAVNAHAEGGAPWRHWKNSTQAGHALAGKIWSVREKKFVTPRRLVNDLAKAAYVLIGETHDNADHHLLQAWLIDQIAATRKPAVVMEMIGSEQSEALDAYMARSGADAAGLGPALDWAKSGWPEWPQYQPIAEAVFRAGLKLAPGNLSRAATRSISRRGLEFLDEVERKRLSLDEALAPKLGEALNQDIRESHCNLLPETALGPMTQVQRYRDAVLASALVRAGREAGAILITGNGHARADRGVPWYLARQDEGKKISTVMLLEITEDAKTVEDLIVSDPDGRPAADYFWFTPRAEREDQCEKLRKRFGK